MARRIAVIAALVLLAAGVATGSEGRWRRQGTSEPGLNQESIANGGVVRSLAWYAGSSVGTEPVPVVLVLHGGGGSAEQVWSGDDGRAWRRLADEQGLVLLLPWEGGCIGRSGCGRGTVLSTEETVSFWIDVDRAATEPECRELPDTDPEDGSTVTVCTYFGGVGGTDVVLYRVDGGGHAPPGPDALPFWYSLIVGPKNHDISAPDEIWAFFERHRSINARVRSPEGRFP